MATWFLQEHATSAQRYQGQCAQAVRIGLVKGAGETTHDYSVSLRAGSSHKEPAGWRRRLVLATPAVYSLS